MISAISMILILATVVFTCVLINRITRRTVHAARGARRGRAHG
jgi:hypothetical protein